MRLLLTDRKADSEGRAVAGSAVNPDARGVGREDVAGDGQSKPGSAVLRPGREVRLEDLVLEALWDANAGVANLELEAPAGPGEAEAEGSAAWHGLLGVEHEIEQDLVKADRVAQHGWQSGLDVDLDTDTVEAARKLGDLDQ